MKPKLKKTTWQLSQASILVFFIIAIILRLEADPLPWEIMWIQPIDEVYYVLNAYMRERHDFYQPLQQFITIPEAGKYYFFGELLTSVSFKTFGLNYIGLRAPILVLGILTAIIWIKSLRTMHSDSLVSFLLLSTFLVDPTVISLFSVQVPQTITITFIAFLLLFFPRIYHTRYFSLYAGGFASFAIFWIYPYLLFVVPAFFIAVVVKNRTSFQKVLLNTAYFFLVFAVIYILFTYLHDYVYGSFPRYDYWDVIFKEASTGQRFSFSDVGKNFTNIFQASFLNVTPFNIALLFLSILALFQKENWKKNNFKFGILLAAGFTAQSLFVNDFAIRKMNVLIPFIFFFSHFSFKISQIHNINKNTIFILLLSCSLIYITWKFNILLCVLPLALLTYIFTRYKYPKKELNTSCILLILLVIAGTNFIYTGKNLIIERRFDFKQTTKSIADRVADGYLIDGFNYGFGLLTREGGPIFNWYAYQGKENLKKDSQDRVINTFGFRKIYKLWYVMPNGTLESVSNKEWQAVEIYPITPRPERFIGLFQHKGM